MILLGFIENKGKECPKSKFDPVLIKYWAFCFDRTLFQYHFNSDFNKYLSERTVEAFFNFNFSSVSIKNVLKALIT